MRVRFPSHQTRVLISASDGMVDIENLKFSDLESCGFESHLAHCKHHKDFGLCFEELLPFLTSLKKRRDLGDYQN